MDIYFDLCVYNRPFDDQTQPRILLETTGLLVVMSVVQTHPKIENRRIIADMLNVAATYIQYNSSIENKALALEQRGIRHFDALHLACAEYAGADFFVTCDDELLKKADTVENVSIHAVSLLEFVAREVF